MPRSLRTTFLMALAHMGLGNLVGHLMCNLVIGPDGAWFYVFLPYTFVWSLSCMVGWDGLSFLIMLFGFLVVMLLFYPIGHYLANRRKTP